MDDFQHGEEYVVGFFLFINPYWTETWRTVQRSVITFYPLKDN